MGTLLPFLFDNSLQLTIVHHQEPKIVNGKRTLPVYDPLCEPHIAAAELLLCAVRKRGFICPRTNTVQNPRQLF